VEALTKIYNTCPFIYENIQHMDVFIKISTVNGDPVADNTSSVTRTPALHVPATPQPATYSRRVQRRPAPRAKSDSRLRDLTWQID
jgi:hypothetical protein